MTVHESGNHLEDIFYHLPVDDERAFADAMIAVEGSVEMALALTREVIADHERDTRRATRRRRTLRAIFPALFAWSPGAIMPPNPF